MLQPARQRAVIARLDRTLRYSGQYPTHKRPIKIPNLPEYPHSILAYLARSRWSLNFVEDSTIFEISHSGIRETMSLASIYQSGQCAISFELFPPKTPRGEKALYRHVDELLQAKPAYFTCTYGAGGTDRGKTIEIVTRVKKQTRGPVAAHLTCVD